MNVDFLTAIKLYFANYVNFSGRSTRAEYWFAVLFICLVSIVLSVFNLTILSFIFSLAILLPSIAIAFRRFHDAGKSGWWVIGLWLVNLVGSGLIFAPIAQIALKYADNADAMGKALATQMSDNIGMTAVGGLIVLAAGIYQLIILVKPSVPDNQYGPNPYGDINE